MELIKLLKTDSISLKFQKGSQMKVLFMLIKKGELKDTRSVAAYFYDGNQTQAWHLCYRLRANLINKLLNTEVGTYSSRYRKVLTEVQRLHSVAQMLMRRRAWKTTVSICKKGIKKAKKIEETLLVLSFAKILHVYYANVQYDSKKAAYYRAWMLAEVDRLSYETRIEGYYNELMSFVMQKHTIGKVEIDIAVRRKEEVEAMLEVCESMRFVQLGYSTIIVAHQLAYEQQQVKSYARKAIAYFRRIQVPIPSSYLTVFYYSLINAHIQSGEYEQAKGMIEQCYELTEVGTQNWIVTTQYACINAFYSGAYEEAVNAFKRVNKRLQIYKHHKERLLIIEAILCLLKRTRRVTWAGKKFRLTTFLNDVPVLAQDKEGLNVTIRIIQVMFLLLDKKTHDDIIDHRLDALKIYSSRYLHSAATARSKLFIRMLRRLVAANFRAKRWAVLVSADWAILQALKNRELEFVPYEVLYAVILEILA